MIMKYQTKGTCSTSIDVEVEDGKIKFVQFFGGCNGNLKGIASLVTGMEDSSLPPALTSLHTLLSRSKKVIAK